MRDLPAIVNAPMAGIAGGALAAGVTRAGGLGFIGGGYGDVSWIDEQLHIADDSAVGVGLITWALRDRPQLIGRVLDRGVGWVWLSFGDPAPYIGVVHQAGADAWCQVQTVTEACRVAAAGADVIVAQGRESGGHGRDNAPLAELLPAVIAAVAPVPVLAAGGITTGVNRQRVMAVGAAGVVIGTRLYASHEALDTAAAKARLVRSAATRRTTVFDLVRGPAWPAGYTGRAIANSTVERWHGREDALRADLDAARRHYRQAILADDTDGGVVWAGTGVARIHELLPTGDIVRAIAGPGAAVPAGRHVSGDPFRRLASKGGCGEDLPHG